MEPEQYGELATNAELDHWPPHLGVKTDAEKVEYLARELGQAAATIVDQDALNDENQALRVEIDYYELLATGTPSLNELAAKSPEALPETDSERLLRERAEHFYRHSSPFTGLSAYTAGWLAAKAHYQPKK